MRFPRLSSLAVAAFVLALPPQLARAQTTDHFNCYKTKATSGTPAFTGIPSIGLVDAIRSSTVEVKKPKFICAPTNKNGEDPTAPSHPDHLEDYSIRPATKLTQVVNQRIVNQFGEIRVDLKKPVALQVPTAKDPDGPPPAEPSSPAVDHLTCYKVKVTSGTPKFVRQSGVTLQDQFGSMTVDVIKPRRLCLPTNKNAEEPGAENHPDHLMCYRIRQTSLPKFVKVLGLFTNNQFGPGRLDARKPAEVCVPSLRNPPTGPTVTPTPTPTPTPTGPTATTTPTATPTPPPGCGNGMIDGSEDCDPPDETACPGQCSAFCQCIDCVLPNPMPEVLSFAAKPGVDLDTGWSGQSHDLPGVDDGSLTAIRLQNCITDTGSPFCGQCDIDGPILFPGPSKNCSCLNLSDRNSSSLAQCDPETPSTCTLPETCECFYGPPLPLSSGAVSVCVVNRNTADLTGTINVANSGDHAGEGSLSIRLEASVHNGPTSDQPCPVCQGDPTPRDGVKGGTCTFGPKQGQPCDIAGTNTFFGAMSFDCPPDSAANIGNLDVVFDPATTGTTTLATSGTLKCTAPGFQSQDCWCDTCATAAAEPCSSNADCPGGAVCGGRRCIGGTNSGAACTTNSQCPSGSCGRPGQATAPNQCDDSICSPESPLEDPDSPNDGECLAGPFDSFCSIETFRGCSFDTDCNPPNCANCVPGQVCTGDFRECFLNPIVRTGMPGTQNSVVAATFCIPPTSSSAINSVTGLPGPGALLQPTFTFRSGAQCGNGVINAGEDCDPPDNGPCAGTCLPDCQCPTCGDNSVNQPSEQCDGTDDANCPGECQGNCTCAAAVCGNDAIEFGEECDGTATGGECPPGACLGDCTCGPFCGDSQVNGSEECDGGASGGQCPASACVAPGQPSECTCGPFCGDGTIDPGEQCDGAMTGSCAGSCLSDCTCAPFCGNNVRETGELCDGTDAPACPTECQVDCTCPSIGELSFVANPNAGDLDTGWTGTSHDFGVQSNSTIPGEIGACDGVTDFECTFLGNVGSRCSGSGASCTESTQCPVGQSCVINTYGPPLPLSSGGVPVCVVNRFSGNVTGTYHLTTGAATINVPLNSLVHIAADVSQPCPVCNCASPPCDVGETGTCSDNPLAACTVEGVGPLGATTNDCPPNPASNVSGSGLNILFNPATTGTSSFASNQPCDGAGFTGQSCWCDGQPQPSACLNGCDGGANDAEPCSVSSECPGGTCTPLCRSIAGQLRNGVVQAVGEAECAVGPVDQRCAGGAGEVGCSDTQPCPPGLGPCITDTRRCFLDPIVREGMPGTTMNVLAATFCIPATTSPAVNSTAGLPGAGSIRFGNTVTVAYCGDNAQNRPSEECDGSDATNCPGSCGADCTCQTVCGNGDHEFGEQCDPGGVPPGTLPDDAACPGTCIAAGMTNECTCTVQVCGDGFAGPGEQCDPGGIPPGTLPDDNACPAQCLANCTCPPPVCGDGVVNGTEICELPQVGCGPLQICVGCTACLP